MRLLLAVLGFATALTIGGSAVASADSIACPYGPASSPSVTLLSATANPGDTVTVNGTGFLVNTTVQATVSPNVAGFPKTVNANASGAISFGFVAPATPQVYTITLTDLMTGEPPTNGSPCAGQASTQLTVEESGSGIPTPTTVPGGGGGDAGSGGALPSTGSDVGPMVRTAAVAVVGGIGLLVVAMRRRRTAASS